MAKYDWNKLEKEYILGDYKSVTSFIEEKGMPNNGFTRKHTSGWKDKKRQKDEQKKTKTIEKAIEKESEKEAKKIANITDTAQRLLEKISRATDELDYYLTRNKTKTKTTQYNILNNKLQKETIKEEEIISKQKGIIDRSALKSLTSALKDLNDIYNNTNNTASGGDSLTTAIQKAYEKRTENDSNE